MHKCVALDGWRKPGWWHYQQFEVLRRPSGSQQPGISSHENAFQVGWCTFFLCFQRPFIILLAYEYKRCVRGYFNFIPSRKGATKRASSSFINLKLLQLCFTPRNENPP